MSYTIKQNYKNHTKNGKQEQCFVFPVYCFFFYSCCTYNVEKTADKSCVWYPQPSWKEDVRKHFIHFPLNRKFCRQSVLCQCLNHWAYTAKWRPFNKTLPNLPFHQSVWNFKNFCKTTCPFPRFSLKSAVL